MSRDSARARDEVPIPIRVSVLVLVQYRLDRAGTPMAHGLSFGQLKPEALASCPHCAVVPILRSSGVELLSGLPQAAMQPVSLLASLASP